MQIHKTIAMSAAATVTATALIVSFMTSSTSTSTFVIAFPTTTTTPIAPLSTTTTRTAAAHAAFKHENQRRAFVVNRSSGYGNGYGNDYGYGYSNSIGNSRNYSDRKSRRSRLQVAFSSSSPSSQSSRSSSSSSSSSPPSWPCNKSPNTRTRNGSSINGNSPPIQNEFIMTPASAEHALQNNNNNNMNYSNGDANGMNNNIDNNNVDSSTSTSTSTLLEEPLQEELQEPQPPMDTFTHQLPPSAAQSLDGRLLCAAQCAYSINIQQPYFKSSAYRPATTAKRITKGVNSVLIGHTYDGITIAFRGTQSSSLLDWLQNAALFLSSVDPIAGKVHTGFYRASKSLWKPLRGVLREMLEESRVNGWREDVYLTGHSKGGALATVAAVLMKRDKELPDPTYVW